MIEVPAFLSFTLAVVLLICGKILTLNLEVLRRYSIPEPVAGGFLCAAAVAVWFALTGQKIAFDLGARDFLLLVFFASIGLKSDLMSLVKGGRPLLILTVLATVFLILQNLLGIAVATGFGNDWHLGLVVGSISLTGGVGTTLAWAPVFAETFGMNVLELGVANTTAGLIVACLVGGPIATWLIRRHRLQTSQQGDLDIGVSHRTTAVEVDYFCICWAIFALNVSVMLGLTLDAAIRETGHTLPAFVSCLFAGILIGNISSRTALPFVKRTWPGVDHALSLVSDLALGLFLTMALMGMQLWELIDSFGFIVVSLTLQVALTVVFALFIVFRLMGRDYEAAVISAGFGGITLGSTATAIANMTAVTQQYGAAHRAFLIVPLVAGFFIDIINALVISAFVAAG